MIVAPIFIDGLLGKYSSNMSCNRQLTCLVSFSATSFLASRADAASRIGSESTCPRAGLAALVEGVFVP